MNTLSSSLPIALGGAKLGSVVGYRQTLALLDAFREAGGSLIDTAHCYAQCLPGGDGASERAVGEWLESRRSRSEIFVITKGGHPRGKKEACERLNESELESDITESLERLKTTYVDAYLLHRDCQSLPVEKLWSILERFKRDGRAKLVGVSNWQSNRLVELINFSGSAGVLNSCAYSFFLFDRTSRVRDLAVATQQMVEVHTKYNIPLLAFHISFGVRAFNIRSLRNVCFHVVAHRLRVSTTGLSVMWLRSRHEFPVIPIVGTTQEAHVRDAVQSVHLHLPQKEIEFLEEVLKCRTRIDGFILFARWFGLLASTMPFMFGCASRRPCNPIER